MTKRPRRRSPAPLPATSPVSPVPDADYGKGAVEGEPGGAQPGPSRPPAPQPPTPQPADAPTPVPAKR